MAEARSKAALAIVVAIWGCGSDDRPRAAGGDCEPSIQYADVTYGQFDRLPPELMLAGEVAGVREGICGERSGDRRPIDAREIERIPIRLALAVGGDDVRVYVPYGTLPQLRTHPLWPSMRSRRHSMRLLRKSCRQNAPIRGRITEPALSPGGRPFLRQEGGETIRLVFADRSEVTSSRLIAGRPLLSHRDRIEGLGWRCGRSTSVLVRRVRASAG